MCRGDQWKSISALLLEVLPHVSSLTSTIVACVNLDLVCALVFRRKCYSVSILSFQLTGVMLLWFGFPQMAVCHTECNDI